MNRSSCASLPSASFPESLERSCKMVSFQGVLRTSKLWACLGLGKSTARPVLQSANHSASKKSQAPFSVLECVPLFRMASRRGCVAAKVIYITPKRALGAIESSCVALVRYIQESTGSSRARLTELSARSELSVAPK